MILTVLQAAAATGLDAASTAAGGAPIRFEDLGLSPVALASSHIRIRALSWSVESACSAVSESPCSASRRWSRTLPRPR